MKKFLIALAIFFTASTAGFAQNATPAEAQTKKTRPAKSAAPVAAKPAAVTVTAAAPLKADGTPDKRYKANRKLKKDGTEDLRFRENRVRIKN